jgi:uncharacterized protein (DUF4415 family)
MRKEYELKKMKGAKKGAVVDPKATKVQISTRIDLDLLSWLQFEAEKMGIGYQTLLNIKLRESQQQGSSDEHIREIVRDELRKKGA